MSRRQNVYRADIGLIFPEAATGRRHKYHVSDNVAVSAELMLADVKWQKISWRRGTKEGPLLYNCSAGQDRTGVTTAIILSALGVARETIYADYLLSTPSRRPQWELPQISDAMAQTSKTAGFFAALQKNPAFAKHNPLMTTDGTPFPAYAFQAIDAQYGSIDTYLEQEIGVSKVDLAALRTTYFE
jgi:protein-tyrosine phosphatase